MKKYFLVHERCDVEKILYDEYDVVYGNLNKYSRISSANTLEDLKRSNKILDIPCKICDGCISTNYSNAKELIDNQLCFSCLFWNQVLSENKKNQFIINGNIYTKSDNKLQYPKGFGGRGFKIQRLDTNEIIETDNLWHRGEMTRWYKFDNPDDAKFI